MGEHQIRWFHGLAILPGQAKPKFVAFTDAQRPVVSGIKTQGGMIDFRVDHAVGKAPGMQLFAALRTQLTGFMLGDLGMVHAGEDFRRSHVGRKKGSEPPEFLLEELKMSSGPFQISGHALADEPVDPLESLRGEITRLKLMSLSRPFSGQEAKRRTEEHDWFLRLVDPVLVKEPSRI